MELTQFVSYLDYGVLGLSAIILILSFILLSREQKREVFRPEVEKAIRRYMLMALAFAVIGLFSVIIESMLVRPAKAEKKKQESRMDLLSNMVSREMERRMEERDIADNGIKGVEPLTDSLGVDSIGIVAEDKDSIDWAPTVHSTIPDYERIKKSVFMSFYDFNADKELFTKALNNLEKSHPEIKEDKEKILKEYDDLASLKLNWLEQQAIPSVEKIIKDGTKNPKAIVDLPSELVANKNGNNKVIVSDINKLKKEAELLRTGSKKK